jgi:hypothetical protein
MKAAVVSSFGAAPRYQEFPAPAPAGNHDMVIDVIAAGLHPRVRSQADGSHYTSTGELPLVPGIDGVGRDYLWGQPTAAAMTAVVTGRADRGRPLTWIELGSVAGPTAPIPSAALSDAHLTIVGSGQGSVTTREILAELPALAQQITNGPSTSTPGPYHWPALNKPGTAPPMRHSASFSSPALATPRRCRRGALTGHACSVSVPVEGIVDPGPQGGQGCGAGLPGGHLPAAQHQQGRDGLGVEPLRDPGRGVHVHLDQLHPASQVAGELLERGADHAARPAPGRPQVHDDRDLGGVCDLAERGIVGVGDPRQRLMALAAAGGPGRRGRHAVRLAAVPAPDQSACHGLIIPRRSPRRRAGSR